MQTSDSKTKTNSCSGKIIQFTQMPGPKQMAIDSMLLDKALIDPSFSMAIRFYKWEGNWLSIGKNQTDIPSRWINLVDKKILNIVRRPTGGTAVLHSGGLTYALIWKSPPRKKRDSYFQACQFLINFFFNSRFKLKFW